MRGVRAGCPAGSTYPSRPASPLAPLPSPLAHSPPSLRPGAGVGWGGGPEAGSPSLRARTIGGHAAGPGAAHLGPRSGEPRQPAARSRAPGAARLLLASASSSSSASPGVCPGHEAARRAGLRPPSPRPPLLQTEDAPWRLEACGM
ncbi:E3 ubiquitin-protein ligase synoviolin-like [Oryctolagus cuniculus]|uniref:E3 ubiquitin-protein ligase synoviolin-like n=1 Tax=Oryctolagus cuniculus TaxID=9986 RepID=UPI0038791165